MKTLFGTHLFTAGGRSYYWEDVAIGARLWSDWTALEEQVREGIACLKRLAREECTLDPAELKAVADAFRYERKLLSAEEAEAWLQERQLTVEMWSDYVQRKHLRQKWSAELGDITARHPVTAAEIDEAITCEGICSGRLAELGNKLAARAAVFARGEPQMEEGDLFRRPPAHERIASELAELGLPGFPLEFWRERVDLLARVEAAFARFCSEGARPEAVDRALGVHHLDWIAVDYRFAPFRDEEAAREALLCMREDGAELAEVARRAGSAEGGGKVLLEQVDSELRPHLLGAQKGDVLGPVRWRDSFVIVSVHEKEVPSVRDPKVRDRARQAALQGLIEREVRERVRWA